MIVFFEIKLFGKWSFFLKSIMLLLGNLYLLFICIIGFSFCFFAWTVYIYIYIVAFIVDMKMVVCCGWFCQHTVFMFWVYSLWCLPLRLTFFKRRFIDFMVVIPLCSFAHIAVLLSIRWFQWKNHLLFVFFQKSGLILNQ